MSLYFTTFNTFRYDLAPSDAGGELEDEVPNLINQPCRIDELSGDEKVTFGKLSTDMLLTVYCDPCDIVETDKLVINITGYPANQFADIHMIEPVFGMIGLDHLEIVVEIKKVTH
jgi:hypothetical protein